MKNNHKTDYDMVALKAPGVLIPGSVLLSSIYTVVRCFWAAHGSYNIIVVSFETGDNCTSDLVVFCVIAELKVCLNGGGPRRLPLVMSQLSWQTPAPLEYGPSG